MKRELEFVKMSGAGNDFVVVDGDALGLDAAAERRWVRDVCRRRHSVGADGVLLIAERPQGRIEVRFRNPDGSAAFCGNGTRCAARYGHDRGLAGASMELETAVGIVPATVEKEQVRLLLPAPVDRGKLELDAGDGPRSGRFVDAGCPHFVLFVERPADAPLHLWGPELRRHPAFGDEGANIDLVAAGASPRELRTWERGVEGETLACGSGAVAAAYASFLAGNGRRHRLLPAGGIALEVELPGEGDAVEAAMLSGDARVVYEGRLDLPA